MNGVSSYRFHSCSLHKVTVPGTSVPPVSYKEKILVADEEMAKHEGQQSQKKKKKKQKKADR